MSHNCLEVSKLVEGLGNKVIAMLALLIVLDVAPAFFPLLLFNLFPDNVAQLLLKAYWVVNVPFAIVLFFMIGHIKKVVAVPIILLFIFSPISGALFYLMASIQTKMLGYD